MLKNFGAFTFPKIEAHYRLRLENFYRQVAKISKRASLSIQKNAPLMRQKLLLHEKSVVEEFNHCAIRKSIVIIISI